MTQIVAAEYFYDNDPGVGSATALTVTTPGNVVASSYSIPVPQNFNGIHYLAIRVKNATGNWGLFDIDTLTIGTVPTIDCRADTVVTASAGNCSAVVNGLDPVVSPTGTTFTHTLTGATTGTGTGTASGKTFNAGITIVTYTAQGGTSCSFTVTVNTTTAASVTVSATSANICAGTNVIFTATHVNGGTPAYQWKLNGVNTGSNGNTYQNANLAHGDMVTVTMTSSLSCASPQTATSNVITMAVQAKTTFYRDTDGDGYGNAASGTVQACSAPTGYTLQQGDCNDNNNAVHPGATEVCGNNIDDNCNGTVDENCPLAPEWKIPTVIKRNHVWKITKWCSLTDWDRW
jgi:hypothetical protein